MEPVEPSREMAAVKESYLSASSLMVAQASFESTGAAMGCRLGSGSVPDAPLA
jgi:hypothetical protein